MEYFYTAAIFSGFMVFLFALLCVSKMYISSIKCHQCIYKDGFTTAQISGIDAKQKTIHNGFSSGFAGSGSEDMNPITKNYLDPSFNSTYYDSNNYYTQYHDTVDVIIAEPDVYGLPVGTVWVLDPYGNKVAMLDPNAKTNFTYYEPGKYSRFGSGNYVPSYSDSVYLSQSFNFLPKSIYAR